MFKNCESFFYSFPPKFIAAGTASVRFYKIRRLVAEADTREKKTMALSITIRYSKIYLFQTSLKIMKYENSWFLDIIYGMKIDIFFYMHCALIPIDYVDTGYGRVLETSCWLCSDGAVHCCIFHHLPLLFWLSSASVKIHSTSSSVSGTSDIRLTATMDQTCKRCLHGRGRGNTKAK